MLQSGMKESQTNKMTVTDVQPHIFQKLLEYIYAAKVDSVSMKYKELIELTKASDKYGLEELKEICFQSLAQKIDIENCGDIIVLAYLLSAEEYRKHALDFCKE